MAKWETIVHATGTLTFTDQPLNTETVTIGGKVYTFQTTLTDVDGNVKIGADLATSISNLAAAIELGAGSGTAYAASMTRNPAVEVYSTSGTVLVVKAPGGVANLIDTTETLTNASWGGAVMSGGSGNLIYWARGIVALNQLNAEVMGEFDVITVEAD